MYARQVAAAEEARGQALQCAEDEAKGHADGDGVREEARRRGREGEYAGELAADLGGVDVKEEEVRADVGDGRGGEEEEAHAALCATRAAHGEEAAATHLATYRSSAGGRAG